MSDNQNERVLGSALSIPLNLVIGLADLLIGKGVLSKAEMVDLVRRIQSQAHGGEHGENIKFTLEAIAARFESDQKKEPTH